MATAAITRARLAAQLEATTAILRVQDEQLRLAHVLDVAVTRDHIVIEVEGIIDLLKEVRG